MREKHFFELIFIIFQKTHFHFWKNIPNSW